MAPQTRTVLELRAGPLTAADVIVTRVTGRESLSRPFLFSVEFHPVKGVTVALPDLVGHDALLSLRRADGTERLVHGIVAAPELSGVAAGLPYYRARIVPRLALLAHTGECRIFQEKSVPDIVQAVLGEHQVALKVDLVGSYAPREYCVQYRESDLQFVERLLAEEGIFYAFEHAEGAHTMVLADDTRSRPDIPGDAVLPWRTRAAAGDTAQVEHVVALARALSVEAKRATLADYDFERPALDLTVRSGAEEPEVYEYPAGYTQSQEGNRCAKLRLEEAQRDARRFDGETTCLRLLPGSTFEVSDHPDAELSRKLLVVGVRHEAGQSGAVGGATVLEHGYANSFEALAAGDPFRPTRTTRRPLLQGSQTATVVGPGGEEIADDKHGRIKVQFHWDRQGKRDDHSSCWVRIAQRWAGPGFGASFVPRIGQEVVVRFLEGDPDRPLVTGAVYNGQHPTPIALPGDRTRSTLRTDSSPGGGGSNELRFEDHAGHEQVYVHAQRDHDIVVENDKTQRVGNDESLLVEKDRSRTVRGDQILAVDKDDNASVGGNQTLAVALARRTTVAHDHSETVSTNQSVTVAAAQAITVGAASATTVGGAMALSVGGVFAITVGGAYNEAVGAARATQIGAAHEERVGGARDEDVAKSSTASVGGDFSTEVAGSAGMLTAGDQQEEIGASASFEVKDEAGSSAKTIRLEAEDELSFVVGGKTVLELSSSGDVKLDADKVTVAADGKIELKGGKVQQ